MQNQQSCQVSTDRSNLGKCDKLAGVFVMWQACNFRLRIRHHLSGINYCQDPTWYVVVALGLSLSGLPQQMVIHGDLEKNAYV